MSPRQQGHSGALGVLLAAVVAVGSAVLLWLLVPVAVTTSDAGHYLGMAAGEPAPRPFAFRVLAPWLAAHLAALLHLPLLGGFRVLGGVAVAALVFCLVLPLLRPATVGGDRRATAGRTTSALLCVCVLLTPVLPALWSDQLLPDLLHAALTAVYLLLLRSRRWTAAAIVLPLLFLARESTTLLAVVAVLVLWRLAGRRVGLTQLAGAVVGWLLSSYAGSRGLGNERGLGNGLYLLGKVPHNLLKNVLGISLWAEPLDGPRPAYLWNVPAWLHLGHIRQIGLTAPVPGLPMHTLLIALTCFGAGVAALVVLWQRRHGVWPVLRQQPALLLAAVYGLLSWLVAPALGTNVDRLFQYGWPLFLWAVPQLLLRLWQRPLRPVAVAGLLGLHLLLGGAHTLFIFTIPRFPLIAIFYGAVPAVAAAILLTLAIDLLRPALTAAPE